MGMNSQARTLGAVGEEAGVLLDKNRANIELRAIGEAE